MNIDRRHARVVLGLWSVSAWAMTPACRRTEPAPPAREVTVYCSVDEGFARPILATYEAAHHVRVTALFDSEAGKTTGLVNRIIAESDAGRPRADVFWSSELFNTIRLGRMGLLEPYDSPAAADIPERFRDEKHLWTALAVRARVLAFLPEKTPADQMPIAWADLADPRHAARVAIANPLFGTTRGHVAAMFALGGAERGRAFLRGLKDGGALVLDSNSATVRGLLAGRAQYAATDTDDVWVAQRDALPAGRQGASIDLVYPDMGDGGTLLIPCSVAMLKRAWHPEAARELLDFLASAEVERKLALSDSRNIPVREALREELGIAWPPETKVPFDAIADAMDEAMAAVRDILIR